MILGEVSFESAGEEPAGTMSTSARWPDLPIRDRVDSIPKVVFDFYAKHCNINFAVRMYDTWRLYKLD